MKLATTLVIALGVFGVRLHAQESQSAGSREPRVSDGPAPGDQWTRVLKDRGKRGTLRDAYQYVRGDSGKWNDDAILRHAPRLGQHPKETQLDDWADQLIEQDLQTTPKDDNWLLLRTRQLDDNDRVWIERIERRENRFTVVVNEAIWQGRYQKTFTYHSVFGINLGKLEPGQYTAECIIKPLAFKQFEGEGRPLGNWPKDERSADAKAVELQVAFSVAPESAAGAPLDHIRVSEDGTHFVRAATGMRFVVWGVNYDHDGAGRLIDEYWTNDWQTVVEDFREIKTLGANCVRIHLQVGKFMDAPDKPNAAALTQLAKLIKLSEDMGLYLDVTGLACYHKKNIPVWYDKLSEQERWSVQAAFWDAIAGVCGESPAIFCYDLMNEPILPGNEPAAEWLAGELADKYFVQQLTLDLKGRTREQVAEAWVNTMVDAIRKRDQRHMITVGVIPWVLVFGGGKPLFYSPTVGTRLDFVAVHFYPEKDKVDKALTALKAYEVDKPLVIEEMFPLKCGQDELVEFIEKSAEHADGWISFYWGETSKELRAKEKPTFGEAITASWLDNFQAMSDRIAR